jgi:hypothetical protein
MCDIPQPKYRFSRNESDLTKIGVPAKCVLCGLLQDGLWNKYDGMKVCWCCIQLYEYSVEYDYSVPNWESDVIRRENPYRYKGDDY